MSSENILICPLGWGLGHASRMTSIGWRYLNAGKSVTFAGNENVIRFIKAELPDAKTIIFKGYSPIIPSQKWLIPVMALLQLPVWLIIILWEHTKLNKLLKNNHFDLVISDNRPGLYSHRATCIYVTHQLNIQMPSSLLIFQRPVNAMHRYFIKKFDECWIPDDPSVNLSGILSLDFQTIKNLKYTGILSRFEIPVNSVMTSPAVDIIVIASGTEPQRSIYIGLLTQVLSKMPLKSIIFTGKFQQQIEFSNTNVMVMPYTTAATMKSYLLNTQLIIARSGYSTLMDLFILNQKALLIPTPGQSEQEYLAQRMNQVFGYPVLVQDQYFKEQLRIFIENHFNIKS